jgi:hypothetical protein
MMFFESSIVKLMDTMVNLFIFVKSPWLFHIHR